MGELTHINCVALTARFPVGKPVVPAALMNRPTRGEGGLRIGRSSASSLTDSLRSVVRLRRAVSTHSKAVIRLSTESGDNAGKNMQNALRPARETSEHDRRRVPRRPRSGGRPPPPRTRSARRRRHRRRGRADCSSNRSPARRSTRSGTTASPRRPPSPPSRTWSARSRCRWASPAPSASTAAPSPAKVPPPRDHRGRAPRVGQPRLLGHQQRRRLTARVLKSGMTRAPVFRVADVAEAEGARLVDPRQLRGAEGGRGGDDEPRRTPRRDAVRRRQLGVPAIPLRHQGRDGDEHGHHRHRGRLRRRRSRDGRLARRPLRATSVPTKKPAAINAVEGRGRSVTADVRIPREVVEERLHTTPEAVAELNTRKNLVGSAKAASLGFNAHVANVVAAMFLATGQDEAQVVEGANAITTAEVQDGDLYVSVSIASLEVGTVGGGTKLRRSPGASISSASAAAATRRLQRRRPRQMHRRRFPRGRTLPSLRARLAAPLQRPRRTRSVTAWGLLSDRDS